MSELDIAIGWFALSAAAVFMANFVDGRLGRPVGKLDQQAFFWLAGPVGLAIALPLFGHVMGMRK